MFSFSGKLTRETGITNGKHHFVLVGKDRTVIKGAASRGILSFSNETKLQHLLIYLQNDIKTSGERNPPSFERNKLWTVLAHFRSKNPRTFLRTWKNKANLFQVQFIETRLINH